LATWTRPPKDLALVADSVDVWRARLDAHDAEEGCGAILSSDERARADSIHLASERRRYVVSRGVARMLLARYANVAPESIRFRYGRHGKPELESGYPLELNVAHAGERAIYAFARRPIGVDVELVREDVDHLSLAKHAFSEQESAALGALSGRRRSRAFYACWTRKEAYVKALGVGLAMPLSEFSVSVDPDGPAALLAVASSPDEPRAWALRAFSAGEGYPCAFAVRAPVADVRFFDVLQRPGRR
jgi:4'-phosphopantetheinyl transferase